ERAPLRALDSGRQHVDRRGHRAAADRHGDARDRDGRARARRVRGQHLLPQGRARRFERPVRRARGPYRAGGRSGARDRGPGARDPAPSGGFVSAPATPVPAAAPAIGREDGLQRGLNLWDTTLLILGLVIGGGIFLTPAAIARALPAPGWILAVWVIGGLLTIAGGLVYAELGAMMPEAGGMYVYIGRAFGPLPGFLYAWIAYFVIIAGSNAAVAVGFAEYFSAFFPSLSTKNVLFVTGSFPVSAGQL